MGKYFTIKELCHSDTAIAHKLDNSCKPEYQRNLEALITNVLDPLRVNSGYRCMALNKILGGVHNSEHLKGMAADITGGSKEENKKLFDLIQQLNLPFRQLINEKNFSWVHVSYNPTDIKKQVIW